jgi:cellulose synthase/poly-beta-1,6-N-acetylglucosamine synthase-like glycosyltransferase
VVHTQTHDRMLIGYWWFGMSVIVFCVMSFVVGRRFTNNPIAPGRVLCIIPAYNEDPDALRTCVLSIANQTVPVDIVVIDDGSAVPVQPFNHPRVRWIRQDNTGKRGAQVAVLRKYGRDEYQYILTVDSDSAPYPDALEHLLRAMSNPKVQAATGMIYIRNYGDSLVARAADMDIGTSCVMMRASRSMLGALETTSGALALYRANLLYDHLEEYAVECGTGDDRWLALRALMRGEVVGVAEAGVETDMPTTLNGTYRQRLRWARSWWWMLPYVFRNLNSKQLISPAYGLLQLLIAPIMTVWALVGVVVTGGGRYSGHLWALSVYVIAYATVRFGLSALYLVGRPNVPARQKWMSFLVGTVSAILLNLLWLTPIRYYALLKLRDNRWQTRVVAPQPAGSAAQSTVPPQRRRYRLDDVPPSPALAASIAHHAPDAYAHHASGNEVTVVIPRTRDAFAGSNEVTALIPRIRGTFEDTNEVTAVIPRIREVHRSRRGG